MQHTFHAGESIGVWCSLSFRKLLGSLLTFGSPNVLQIAEWFATLSTAQALSTLCQHHDRRAQAQRYTGLWSGQPSLSVTINNVAIQNLLRANRSRIYVGHTLRSGIWNVQTAIMFSGSMLVSLKMATILPATHFPRRGPPVCRCCGCNIKSQAIQKGNPDAWPILLFFLIHKPALSKTCRVNQDTLPSPSKHSLRKCSL